MDNKKKPCACVKDCPCYPRCDEMMEQDQMSGGIPQEWWRGQPQRMGWNMGVPAQGAMQQPGMMRQMDTMTMMQPETMQQGGAVRQPAPVPWQNRMPRPNMQESTMEEEEQDWQRLKELYPDMAKIILVEVERACDKMEYEGSAMFDVIPDKTRVRGIADEILATVSSRIPAEQVEAQADLYTMNREPCRNCRPNQNFLGDFIQVLLFQEMFHRRCRHRNCRRW